MKSLILFLSLFILTTFSHAAPGTVTSYVSTPKFQFFSSAVQVKIDDVKAVKADKASPTFQGTVVIPSLTLGLTPITATGSEINKLAGTPAGLTATEIGYVDGVTGNIQGQFNNIVNTDINLYTFTGTHISALETIKKASDTGWNPLTKSSCTGCHAAQGVVGDMMPVMSLGSATTHYLPITNFISHNDIASPASNATCNPPDTKFDANYIYRCVATNTWKRVLLESY